MSADQRLFVHFIDAEDRIVYISPEWLDFAAENAYARDAAFFLQRPLWDFVDDSETRYLYRTLLDKVRARGGALSLPYRCDSPDCRRFMEMRIVPESDDGRVRFESRILRLQPRPHVPLLDPATPRSHDLLKVCGWCKRVDCKPHSWLEAEQAIQLLGLFESAELPAISHGICPQCADQVEMEIRRNPPS